jgi:hypothetical protein
LTDPATQALERLDQADDRMVAGVHSSPDVAEITSQSSLGSPDAPSLALDGVTDSSPDEILTVGDALDSPDVGAAAAAVIETFDSPDQASFDGATGSVDDGPNAEGSSLGSVDSHIDSADSSS